MIPSVLRSTGCARFRWAVAHATRVASILGQHLVSSVKSVSRLGVPSNRPDIVGRYVYRVFENSFASTAVYGYTVRLSFGVGACRASIRCKPKL
jgi:hypothetical protein